VTSCKQHCYRVSAVDACGVEGQADMSGTPPFTSGPYLMTARVQQWNGSQVCRFVIDDE
jgi:hypothetical protein